MDSVEDYRRYIDGVLYFKSNDSAGNARVAKDFQRGDRTQELTKIIINQDANRYMQSLSDVLTSSTSESTANFIPVLLLSPILESTMSVVGLGLISILGLVIV